MSIEILMTVFLNTLNDNGYARERLDMATPNDLLASERAMQMICALCNSGTNTLAQLANIDRIVNAWVHHPNLLTPNAMIDHLPFPRSYSNFEVYKYHLGIGGPLI